MIRSGGGREKIGAMVQRLRHVICGHSPFYPISTVYGDVDNIRIFRYLEIHNLFELLDFLKGEAFHEFENT